MAERGRGGFVIMTYEALRRTSLERDRIEARPPRTLKIAFHHCLDMLLTYMLL